MLNSASLLGRPVFSHDNQYLAAAAMDGSQNGLILFWNWKESSSPGGLYAGFELFSPVLAFSPDVNSQWETGWRPSQLKAARSTSSTCWKQG